MLTETPTPTTNLSQDKFEKLLFDQLIATAGPDKVLFNHTWDGYTESGSDCSSTITSSEGPIEFTSRYLIGADGAGSRVRKTAGIDMIGPDNIQTFINIHFSANLREPLSGREALLYWVMDEEVAGTFIAHDIDSNWIFMKSVDADEPLDTIDEDKFAALLQKAIGADVPATIQSMSSWRMTAQIAAHYRRGRVFLVGDAAHRFPPTGGIGMNTGFQDAHNLVWKIAMVEAGLDASILDTYESERKPVAETNSEQSLTNAKKMFEVAAQLDTDDDHHISATDLKTVLADKDRMAAVQQAVDAQAEHFNMSGLDLGVCYTGSGVIDNGPAPQSTNPGSIYVPSTTPGARLPHALLKRGDQIVSTLDLVRYDCFQLLLQGHDRDTEAAVAELAQQGLPISIQSIGTADGLAPADHTYSNLFPQDEVLLLRPDGHIASRFPADRAADELAKAMNKLCPGITKV